MISSSKSLPTDKFIIITSYLDLSEINPFKVLILSPDGLRCSILNLNEMIFLTDSNDLLIIANSLPFKAQSKYYLQKLMKNEPLEETLIPVHVRLSKRIYKFIIDPVPVVVVVVF